MTVIRTLICLALIAVGLLLPAKTSEEFDNGNGTKTHNFGWYVSDPLKFHHTENRAGMNKQAGEQVGILFQIGIETILLEKTIMKKEILASYLVRIGAIPEGRRNKTLYKIGIYLRKNFGLHGDNLLQHLLDLNSAKCVAPLDDDEVETIARSVDRSRTPLGSLSCPVDVYLAMEISFFPSATSNTPSATLTIGQFLDDCKNGKYQDQVEAIRVEPDKERRNVLKKGLPAVTIQSEVCEQRKREFCNSNAIVCLDFDGVEDVEKVKQTLAALPCVLAVFKSASGRGVCALVVLDEPAPDLKPILKEIQKNIEYNIDMACSDISRLRFVSYDPDLILKDSVVPYREKWMITLDVVLNPKTPLASADQFLKTNYTVDGIPTLIHHADDYWLWTKNVYRCIEPGEVRKKLLLFLKRAKVEYTNSGDNDISSYGSFPVVPSNLNSIIDMLKTRIFQSANEVIPCWIGDESCKMPSSVVDPSLLIFGKDKILNLKNMEILSHSPHWFNTAALDFDYDPHAKAPQWMGFLDSIFAGDEESKQTLMEWMGLCLTSITHFQKALFLVGPKRSGKGTIARILQKIVGYHNTVSPTTSDFGQRFGLTPLIGKTLAVVSDARFAGRTSSQVTERILNITGEDMLTIDRKNRQALTLRLPTKLMFISNELPNILDQSGALASRFIFLKLTNSFFGKEDVELEKNLSQELPGILRLAIQHLENLLERGQFIQPKTGKGLVQRMMSLSSPVSEFIQQLTPYMTKDEIWDKWAGFCDNEGLQGWGTKNVLWNNLESAGYNCDFDTADILAKIRNLGGEATIQDFRNSISKYHKAGGTEALSQKLSEMIEAGLLTVRDGRAANGRELKYYSMANVLDDSCADDS